MARWYCEAVKGKKFRCRQMFRVFTGEFFLAVGNYLLALCICL